MLASAILCVSAAASPSLDGLAAVRSVLQRTEGATTCREDVLVRRLTALGAESAPALFTLVTGEAIEELLGDTGPEAWLCAPDQVGALALATLAELPEVPVRAALRARVDAQPERAVRVAALTVLGQRASAGGLTLFFELLTESGDELELRSVRVPASEALAAILRADGEAVRVLERPLLAAPLAQQRLVCEALASAGRAEALVFLPKLIGRDVELDLVALETLAHFAERCPWRTSENTAAFLRATLDHRDARLRAAGARALGRARDTKSLAALIARLADPNEDADVTRAALWALRETTGQPRLVAAEAWRAWLEAERTWWRDHGKPAAERLAQGDTSKLAATLRDAQKHPLAREAVVDGLLAVLTGLEDGTKPLACASLAQLGARQAVPALIELLFEQSAEVRAAAWKALRTLTGQDLPAEPRLWEDYAFG
jgi:hypothetical protein